MTTWVKLDDNLPLNPKVRRVSVAARWSYVASICYAGNSRTDGYVPCGALSLVDGTQRIAEELVSAGLWEKAADGWHIHDYLKHNRSKARVETIIETAREAGRASAAKRQRNVEHSVERNVHTPLNGKAAVGQRFAQQSVLSASASASASEEEEVQEGEKQLARVIRSWENATGTTVTNRLGESLADWLELLPEAAIVKAIAETGASNARNWRYCEAILKRYQVEGWADKPARTPAKPADVYREPPPPHIDDVLEAIKNRPHREPRDPGEDALLADMKANNPAAYEAEMALRRRAHERAMST